MAMIDAQPFLTARPEIADLIKSSSCSGPLTQLVARYFRSDKPVYQTPAVKGFLTACELYLKTRDSEQADAALHVCSERLLFCGTKKAFAGDFLKSVRLSALGSWAADDRDFRKSVADDVKTAKKAASKTKGIEESQKREAKLSAIVIRFLTDLQGIDLSPSEKKMLLDRVGGAIGISVSVSPPQVVEKKKAITAKKNGTAAKPKVRSAEELDLMGQVSRAAAAVVAAKKASGKQLDAEDPLIQDLSIWKARLAAFRGKPGPKEGEAQDSEESSEAEFDEGSVHGSVHEPIEQKGPEEL